MRDRSDITVAILVGGFGTRLQSVVSDRPKVLAQVRGRPFLAYLLDQLTPLSIGEVVFCSGYMSEKIQESFGDSYGSLRLRYSKENKPLGTGGGLRLALPCLTSDTILVMNGDSYIDADLAAYMDWFFEQERQASLLLTKMDDTSRYGTVIINKNKTVVAFKEKCDNSESGWINAGIYLMRRSLVSSIPTEKFYSLERDFFPSLTEGELYGYCNKGRAKDQL